MTVSLLIVLALFGLLPQSSVASGPTRTLAGVPQRKLDLSSAPGLGNLHYRADELFQPIALLQSPLGHGTGLFVNGYLLTVYSSDGSSFSNGGIDVWDLSNPREPRLAKRYDSELTHELREAHGIGLARIDGRDVACFQSLLGLHFWDVSDPLNLEHVGAIELPGINGGNYEGVWWVFWQAPYVYAAGTHAGLYVVDAGDPSNPTLVRRMSPDEVGNLPPGQVFVQGNLMVVVEALYDDIRTLDVSDPTTPRLSSVRAAFEGYSQLFTGGRLYTIGNGNDDPRSLSRHDVGHDGSLTFKGIAPVHPGVGNGAYATYQDGYVFAGFSNQILKCDAETLEVVGEGTSNILFRDEDFAVVLGNFVFAGNDHGQGSALIPHQRGRDRTPPRVEWVHPADGADARAATTRVGLTFSDLIDLDSVNERTFRVIAPGGEQVEGTYSLQLGIVNFSPGSCLVPGVYNVIAEGVRDLVGNRSPFFHSIFEVGDPAVDPLGVPQVTLAVEAPVQIGQPANFDVDTLAGATPMTFVWDFGDGSQSAALGAPSTTHAYTDPGRYTVLLSASNGQGTTLATRVQIVHRPLAAEAPRQSSSVVATGGVSYNVNPDNDTLTAVDLDTGQRLFEVRVGANPRTLALAPGGLLWVVCKDDATIHVLTRSDGALTAVHALPRGSQPHGIVLDSTGSSAYISFEATGKVQRLSSTGILLAENILGARPRGVSLSAGGTRLYVTRFHSPGTHGEVFELDAATLDLLRTIVLPFDPGPDTESSGRGVPNYLSQIALAPDGTRGLVPAQKANVARGVFRDGLPLTFESRTRTMVAFVDLVPGTEEIGLRVDLDNRCLAQSAIYSPLGDLVFVAVESSGSIEVLDAETGESYASWVAGAVPRGMAFDGNRLCVHNFLSRSLTILDVSEVLAGTDLVATLIAEVDLVGQETLTSEELLGKRIFYDATNPRMCQDGYLSCAGCHLDGGGDGQVWDFGHIGEGLRNTIPLTGRSGTAHGRLHWSANFDEIQDFETDIRGEFEGDGFMSNYQFVTHADTLGVPRAGLSEALDALAAYVESLDTFPESPYRDRAGQLTSDAQAGRIRFFELGCNSCHTQPHMTDTQTHDVGTILPTSGPISAVDTPTLKGLWLSPPYLHDGRAATLYEIQHGGMAGLTPRERDQLVAYLLQIE